MRRFFFAVALSTIAAAGPMQAWGGDREIADQIIKRLKVQRDAGSLKGFTLDLKVEQGVVLFRGKVSQPKQKEAVLAAASGLEGIRQVVDEIAVTAVPAAAPQKTAKAAAAPAETAKPKTKTKTTDSGFSFRQALAAGAQPNSQEDGLIMPSLTGQVVPVAASEESGSHDRDQQITAAVVKSLGAAQKQGRLRGFGVDVTTRGGDVWLAGQASNEQHKALIMELTRNTAGVRNVIDDINVYDAQPVSASEATPLDIPSAARPVSSVDGADLVGGAQPIPGMIPTGQAPYAMHPGMQQPYAAAGYGGPMPVPAMGQPMPGCAPGAAGAGGYAAGAVAGGTPRYDQPYLPNYAWPGYAAYPNYAAVTYPQQYSPSAWPYIGPFYPYPQVPLGWRKVSLEWDDGWWFLDFTDR